MSILDKHKKIETHAPLTVGKNLDEALSLIEQAVAAAPDAGYIIDSLAWAYYRLGQ